MAKEIYNLHKTIEQLSEIGLEDDRFALTLLSGLKFAGKKSKLLKESFRRYINHAIIHNALMPSPFKKPDVNVLAGPIRLLLIEGGFFGLYPNELAHIVFYGRTASGKTTLIRILLRELVRNGINFIIFDFKRDFRHLLRDMDVLVFRWEDCENCFKFNPLSPPPGVREEVWIATFAETLCQAEGLLTGSKGFLLDLLWELKAISRGQPVSMHELHELVRMKKFNTLTRDARYLEAVRNRIRVMIGVLGGMFDCGDSGYLPRILDRNIVIELDGLTEEPQEWFVTTVLSWLFTYRMAGVERQRLWKVVVLPECQKILSRRLDSYIMQGVPQMITLIQQGRELGLSIVADAQEPAKLCTSLPNNSFCQIALSMTGPDRYEAGRFMALDQEQTEALCTIPGRVAVVKTADRNPHPFIGVVPYQVFVKDVSDYEVISRMSPIIASLKRTPRKTLQEILKVEVDSKTPSEAKKPKIEISPAALDLLEDIRRRPRVPMTKRYSDLRTSAGKGDKLKQKLIRAGLVREVWVRVARRGSKALFLEVTEAGYRALSKEPIKEKGKGGFKHRLMAETVADYLRQKGYRVVTEKDLNGKLVDLVSERDGERIGVEITVHFENVVENLRKDLDAGLEKVIVVFEDAHVGDKAREMTAKAFSPSECARISFAPFYFYYMDLD